VQSDPFGTAWHVLGVQGGGDVQGDIYDARQCRIEALSKNPHFAVAWESLGEHGGGTANDVDYDPKSLSLDPDNADCWASLAKVGGGTFCGVPHTPLSCALLSVALGSISSASAAAMDGMEELIKETLHLDDFNLEQYLITHLTENLGGDPIFDAVAWKALAFRSRRGSVSMGERRWGRFDLLGKALQIVPNDFQVLRWMGTVIDIRSMVIRSLELNPHYSMAWALLAKKGGGAVSGQRLFFDACLVKAVTLDPENHFALKGIGKSCTGLSVGGVWLTAKTALLIGLSINSDSDPSAVVELRRLLAHPESQNGDETGNEDEEFEQPPASSEEPNVDPQGDDTRFHGFGGVDSEMSTSSHPNNSDPPVLGLGNVAPLRARQHPREQYTHVRDDDDDDDDTDHAEFLGLFVQRGDVVRTNDGEEEYVYDPAAFPEDSD
jgi:hypothetical protein